MLATLRFRELSRDEALQMCNRSSRLDALPPDSGQEKPHAPPTTEAVRERATVLRLSVQAAALRTVELSTKPARKPTAAKPANAAKQPSQPVAPAANAAKQIASQKLEGGVYRGALRKAAEEFQEARGGEPAFLSRLARCREQHVRVRLPLGLVAQMTPLCRCRRARRRP